MAVVDKNSINFIISNNLAVIGYNNWIRDGASVIDGGSKCVISNNGKITGTSTNQSKLKSSKYLRIDLGLYTDLINESNSTEFNYSDKFNVSITLDYKETDSQEATRDSIKLALNKYNVKNNKFTYIIETANRDYSKISASIINRAGKTVTVGQLAIYRSKDLSEQSLLDAGGITGFDASYIEIRTDNPVNPSPGRIWLRIDM